MPPTSRSSSFNMSVWKHREFSDIYEAFNGGSSNKPPRSSPNDYLHHWSTAPGTGTMAGMNFGSLLHTDDASSQHRESVEWQMQRLRNSLFYEHQQLLRQRDQAIQNNQEMKQQIESLYNNRSSGSGGGTNRGNMGHLLANSGDEAGGVRDNDDSWLKGGAALDGFNWS